MEGEYIWGQKNVEPGKCIGRVSIRGHISIKGNMGSYKGLKNAKGQSDDGYKGPDDCKGKKGIIGMRLRSLVIFQRDLITCL